MAGSLTVERRTHDRKVASSIPGRNSGRIFFFFFSWVNFLYWLLFDVRSAPLLPQWQVKDPGHFAKSAGGRLYLNTHIPLTIGTKSEWADFAVKAYRGNLSRKRAHTQLVKEHPDTVVSAHWTAVDWSWSKEWKKEKKKKEWCIRGMNHRIFPQNPRIPRKSHQHHCAQSTVKVM